MAHINPLFTIGYSSFFRPGDFLECLRANNISALVDVRAFPEIASFDHYRGENLAKSLAANKIHYLSFAAEFGVRPESSEYYTDNIVDFSKIAESASFKSGCARIRTGLENYTICLMCAERNPAVCHRAILITHQLEKLYPEIEIRHILAERIISQKDVDDELKKRYALFEGSLEACYKLHGRSIAWRRRQPPAAGN